jgi:hypothetical protein
VAIPFAHLGHWYVQLAFAAPALLIIGAVRRTPHQGRLGTAGRAPAPDSAVTEEATMTASGGGRAAR